MEKENYVPYSEYKKDMFEVYKNFGYLTRRIAELEKQVDRLLNQQDRSRQDGQAETHKNY
jgi:hypothetical protein